MDPESNTGLDQIKDIEGMLIEAYRLNYKSLPSWNEIGGSVHGQNHVSRNDMDVVRAFCHPEMVDIFPLLSRSSLRELSDNPMYEAFEEVLHAARHMLMISGEDIRSALNTLKATSSLQIMGIEESNYLSKRLLV